MSDSAKKVPVKTEGKTGQRPSTPDLWRPLEKLRQQVDHLFEDFNDPRAVLPLAGKPTGGFVG